MGELAKLGLDAGILGFLLVVVVLFRKDLAALISARRDEAREAVEFYKSARAHHLEQRAHWERLQALAHEGVGYLRKMTGNGLDEDHVARH